MTNPPRTANAIIAELTPELIADALQLPEGAQITGAAWRPLTRRLLLRIDAPFLPDVIEGNRPEDMDLEDLYQLEQGHAPA